MGKKTRKPKEAPSLKLDLGCGQSKQAGFTGVDIVALPGVDVVFDLNTTPWPWADDSVEEAYTSHLVEHVDNLAAFMDELWRVCRAQAKVTIIHPYCKSIRAFQDPFHKRFIPESTWAYFNRLWRQNNKLDHYPITSNYDFLITAQFMPAWAQKAEEARQYAVAHYWEAIGDLLVTATVLKP